MFWLIFWSIVTAVIGYIIYLVLKPEDSEFQNSSLDAFIDNSKTTEAVVDISCNRYTRNYDNEGKQILLLYGTEYGCSEEIGQRLFDKIEAELIAVGSECQPRLVNARDFAHLDLQQERIVLVIISTAGDGVPPTEARDFVSYLENCAEDFSHLSYSVLALGDSNYPHFCRAGKIVDEQFSRLQAHCLTPRTDVDQEDASVIDPWMVSVLGGLQAVAENIDERMDYLDVATLSSASSGEPSRNSPVEILLKVKHNLTKSTNDDSDDKETIHCEFDIEDRNIHWTSGDALGIYPRNCSREVEYLLSAMDKSGSELVNVPKSAYKQHSNNELSLAEALSLYYDMKSVKPELFTLLQKNTTDAHREELDALLKQGLSLKNNSLLQTYLEDREISDVLNDFKEISKTLPADQVLQCMKSLLPRYYSIASSPKIDKNRVCLTVAIVRYVTLGRQRTGVATTYLQDRFQINESIPAFISHNPEFRLPQSRAPVIMIGPGTGIAPFIAFIQERVQQDFKAAVTFLYFGCRHKNVDYLHKEQLECWESSGFLTLRTAFSRDQDYKIYVQDLIKEDGENIWNLIEQSQAHIYICGDAKHMAHDVHKALLWIAQSHGYSTEQAEVYLSDLERQQRYQKDVWIT